MEHFHLYVYGATFEVVTDNTVVALVFGDPRSKPKARLENWGLRLQRYEFSIRHRPGKFNMADYLSRNPRDARREDLNEEAEAYINQVIDDAIPSGWSRASIAHATATDATLIQVKRLIQGQQNSAPPAYGTCVKELSISSDGLVLHGNCVVVPVALRQPIIKLAHHGHQGINKTLALLRRHVWFPDMEAQVQQHVRTCMACAANTNATKIAPLRMTPMPPEPWTDLSVDLYGPLRTGHFLLVLVDEHSRYPVVKKISTSSAQAVIPALQSTFALLGVPASIKSDNGTPFNSAQFAQFAADNCSNVL